MSNRVEYQIRQDLDSSGFDNTYQTLGNSLSKPGVLLKIVNNSSVVIDISTDGSTDHDIVPIGSYFLYDLRSNHGRSYDFGFSKGTQFYVKGAVAGTGIVSLIVLNDAS